MNVTFIGAGNMGRSIGHRLVSGGGDMTVVDRDPEEAGRRQRESTSRPRSSASWTGSPSPTRSCAATPPLSLQAR